jgi:hypothetical protein
MSLPQQKRGTLENPLPFLALLMKTSVALLSVSRRGDLQYGPKGFRSLPEPLIKKRASARHCSSATCTRACSRFSCSFPASFVSLLRCYLHPVWFRFNCFYRALFFSVQCQLHWAGFRFILSCRLPSFPLRRHLRRVLPLSRSIPRQS